MVRGLTTEARNAIKNATTDQCPLNIINKLIENIYNALYCSTHYYFFITIASDKQQQQHHTPEYNHLMPRKSS